MAFHDAALLNLQGRSGIALLCKALYEDYSRSKSCDIDSFHSGQMFQPLLDIGIYILHRLKRKILGTKSFLVARRNGELLPYFQIVF
jgi:hypothetical protein